jgi:prepilin-type N-terminal cleavage/methylation domain-containing protein
MSFKPEGKLRMEYRIPTMPDHGFSLIEMMICLVILVPIMGAAVGFFSVGVNQHNTEQSSIELNQEARSGLEMMTMELAQAGSHDAPGDLSTTTVTTTINASATSQTISVASSAGFTVGDYVTVDNGASQESVQLTAVGSGTITGVFRTGHTGSVPVRLFALPYMRGVIPPAGLAQNSSANVTTIRFFGDINGNGSLNYVEYAYDANNAQITRTMTPITQTSMNTAVPIITKIKPNSVQFTLYTDDQAAVTSATIRMIVQDTILTGNKQQETELSSRVTIPSAVAASALFAQNQTFGGVNRLPPVPTRVATWANR